jgi:cell division protein FtsB
VTKKLVFKEDGAKCTGNCEINYHFECLGISKTKTKQIKMHLENWKCRNCEGKSAEDPRIMHGIDTKLSAILDRLAKLEEMSERVNKIEDSLEDLNQNIEFINEKYDEIIKNGGGVANKQLEQLTNENKELVAQVDEYNGNTTKESKMI